MKEKQALYYRRKCEQFLGDIDKLVNAKISQKGSQLIYNLDVSQRELRVLKDNYRLMDKQIMDELHHQYQRAIQDERSKVAELRNQRNAQTERLTNETYAEFQSDFKDILEKMDKKKTESAFDIGIDIDKPIPAATKKPAPERMVNPLKDPDFDDKPLRKILDLHFYFKKHQAFTWLKTITMQERHEKELANQKAQLTSNAALWDQLAEAEKRE